MIPAGLGDLRQQVSDAITRHRLADHREAILATLEPCVLLEDPCPKELAKVQADVRTQMPKFKGFGFNWRAQWLELFAEPSPVGASRIGGLPDLPEGCAWPEHEGRKLPFIAQLDLASLPRWPEMPLPERGNLWFFCCPCDEIFPPPTAVIYAEESSLIRVDAPEADELWAMWDGDEGRVEQAVPVRPVLSISAAPRKVIMAAGLPPARKANDPTDQFDKVLGELVDEFNKSGYYDGQQPAGQILGEMTDVFTSPEEAVPSVLDDRASFRSLLEVGSVGSMMWSDAGLLTFFIRDADLRAGHFGDVVTSLTGGG